MKRASQSLEDAIHTPQSAKRRGRRPKKEGLEASIESDSDIISDDTPATVHPRNQLNDLTAREWIPETVSVWNQRGLGAGHPDAQIERQHPAPFSFTDVGRLIRFFTKKGHTVLDPFVGVGSTLKACAIEPPRVLRRLFGVSHAALGNAAVCR